MTSDTKSLEEKFTEEEMKSDPAVADEEKLEESSDKEDTKSEGEEKKPSSKRGRKREKKEVLPVTPTIERPTRERKVVERYTESSGARNASPKPLTFEKGRGTPLRDIPNVAFLLSKKKADDNLQMLHTILFGRKSKVNMLKRNIGMFSGFVWTESEEEKQRGKLKDKLDKCVKDKLFYFCDVLNIPVNKTSSKKEELSAKLLDFLESPHSTTDVLLADKEKKGKRTRRTSGTSGKSAKKQKNSTAGEKRKQSSKSEDEEVDDTIEHSDSQEDSSGDDEDDMVAKAGSDQAQSSSDEDGEENEEPKKLKHSDINSSKKSTKKVSGVQVKEKSKAVEKDAPMESPKSSNKRSSSSKPMKVASTSKIPKKQKVEKDSGKAEDEANEKASSKSSAKAPKSDQGKGKSDKKATEEPSREEMHAVVVLILKKVDFNTATLSDILRQLGDHFGVELMHRKAEVKAIITEAINNMTDEEDEEDEGSEGESDKGKDGDNGDA